jgi:hypothetical protein
VVTGRRVLRRAIVAMLSEPQGWLLGSAGFLVRGGILVLAVPVWALPSPVGVSLLLGPFAVDAGGVTPQLVGRLATAVALASVGILACAVVAAACDLASFERTTRARLDADPVGREPWQTRRAGRARLIASLTAIEVVALLPAVAAAWFTVGRLAEVGRVEYLLPSSLDIPYAFRVINGARSEVVVLAGCLVLAEFAHAVASRAFLSRAVPAGPRGGPPAGPRDAAVDGTADDRVAPSPGVEPRPTSRHASVLRLAGRMPAIVGTWIVVWVVTAMTLLPGLGLTVSTWQLVRSTYAAREITGDLVDVAVSIGSTVLFAMAWGAAIGLAGLGSAIRSVLWTTTLASAGGDPPGSVGSDSPG